MPTTLTTGALLGAFLIASGGEGGGAGGGGLMQVLEELGIYWQLVLANLIFFLATFFVLRKVLFERVRAHMAARDEELEGERRGLGALLGERDGARTSLAEARKGLEAEAYERTQEQVRKGLERKNADVQKAQHETHEQIKATREACAALRREAVLKNSEGLGDLIEAILESTSGGVVKAKALHAEVHAAVERAMMKREGA